jgi:hypothetical protein
VYGTVVARRNCLTRRIEVAKLQQAARILLPVTLRTRKSLLSHSASAREGSGTKMNMQPLPIAPKRLRIATTPVAITATSRLFGLNIGDWLLMVVGLAVTGLLLLALTSFR